MTLFFLGLTLRSLYDPLERMSLAMHEYLPPIKTGQEYTPLTFPARPTVFPVSPTTSIIVIRIGIQGQEKVAFCENLEEMQFFYDLTQIPGFPLSDWGIISTTQKTK